MASLRKVRLKTRGAKRSGQQNQEWQNKIRLNQKKRKQSAKQPPH